MEFGKFNYTLHDEQVCDQLASWSQTCWRAGCELVASWTVWWNLIANWSATC